MAVQKGEHRGPYKQGYFREMLEKYVFESEEKFATWVHENYTDAVKELGKLQPRDLKLEGGEKPISVIETIIVNTKASDG